MPLDLQHTTQPFSELTCARKNPAGTAVALELVDCAGMLALAIDPGLEHPASPKNSDTDHEMPLSLKSSGSPV